MKIWLDLDLKRECDWIKSANDFQVVNFFNKQV
jgi:hypothetical protein